MRIVAGKYRGRKLLAPTGDRVRPTTDMVKESVFNMLMTDIYDCKFLDLFAGTGAISCEAVSRGAKSVTSVEKSKQSIEYMRKNFAFLSEDLKKIKIENRDVLVFLESTREKYGVIFADPPYAYENVDKILDIIAKNGILKDGGTIVLETDKTREFVLPDEFVIEKQKTYSITRLNIIKEKK